MGRGRKARQARQARQEPLVTPVIRDPRVTPVSPDPRVFRDRRVILVSLVYRDLRVIPVFRGSLVHLGQRTEGSGTILRTTA